jgi:vacuolar-type H+-ATPase subunit I/STV1
MAGAVIEFFEALNRLVERGVKPTLDGVAIEAGRKKGSIRRGLDRHKELAAAIEKAAEEFGKEAEQSKEFKQTARIEKLKKERDEYLARYNALLSEHIGAIYQLEELRIENLELREKLGEQIAKQKAEGTLVSIIK